MGKNFVLHVVLPVPIRQHFDYLCDVNFKSHVLEGRRVSVPFGRKKKTGLIIGSSPDSAVSPDKLKKIYTLIDDEPLLDSRHLELLQWTASYYHYPLGELIFSILPAMLRQGKKAESMTRQAWRTNQNCLKNEIDPRAHKQIGLMNFLSQRNGFVNADELDGHFESWRQPMKSLVEKQLVEFVEQEIELEPAIGEPLNISLNEEQSNALDSIVAGLGSNSRFLLDGITGSGKTEVYLEAIKEVATAGKQTLVLVPEIGLTPQFIARFKTRTSGQLAVLHSGLSDSERLQAWLQARNGKASVVLGTRSAVWTPMANPGLFIVDEEHDQSYKQQDGLRYSARDLAILRASNHRVPVILGSATPSLDSIHNALSGKYSRLTLAKRAVNASPPRYRMIDMRAQDTRGALSATLVQEIEKVLALKQQVLLFQNRRGYSPVLMCHDCGWIQMCTRCDIPLTYHKLRNKMICHHCDHTEIPAGVCVECQSENMVQIGHGTERLYETLEECFPTANIIRFDRDTIRKKGALEDYINMVNDGLADILVGTQILAKGHHFPRVTLVGVIDADRGLFSNDFRAGERMAQLIVQVSGRAGRAGEPGTVYIQTHFPDHPLLTELINNDYTTFASQQLYERESSELPPYSYQALLRAESHETSQPQEFLQPAVHSLKDIDPALTIFGPFPAPIEKRGGKYRFQVLIQCGKRSQLHAALGAWVPILEKMKSGKKIRWSLDIDPQDLL